MTKPRILIADYEKKYADAEAEADRLTPTYDSKSAEAKSLRAENRRLWKEWKHMLTVTTNIVHFVLKFDIIQEFDKEKLIQMDLENQMKSRTDAYSFLERVYSVETKAHGTISASSINTHEFLEIALETAIQSIKREYDTIIEQHRDDLEAFYKVQVIDNVESIQT